MENKDFKELGHELFVGNQYALSDQMTRRLVKIERDKDCPIAECDVQREAVRLQREYVNGLMVKHRFRYDEKSKTWKFISSDGESDQGMGAVEVTETLMEMVNSS